MPKAGRSLRCWPISICRLFQVLALWTPDELELQVAGAPLIDINRLMQETAVSVRPSVPLRPYIRPSVPPSLPTYHPLCPEIERFSVPVYALERKSLVKGVQDGRILFKRLDDIRGQATCCPRAQSTGCGRREQTDGTCVRALLYD